MMPILTLAFTLLGAAAFRLLFVPMADHTQKELNILGGTVLVAAAIFIWKLAFSPHPRKPSDNFGGSTNGDGSGAPSRPVAPLQTTPR